MQMIVLTWINAVATAGHPMITSTTIDVDLTIGQNRISWQWISCENEPENNEFSSFPKYLLYRDSNS